MYSKMQNDYKREDLEYDARDQLLHNGLSDRWVASSSDRLGSAAVD